MCCSSYVTSLRLACVSCAGENASSCAAKTDATQTGTRARGSSRSLNSTLPTILAEPENSAEDSELEEDSLELAAAFDRPITPAEPLIRATRTAKGRPASQQTRQSM